MKKIIALFLSILLIFTFAACGEKSEETVYDGNGTEQINKTVDLTALSSTMVYSEVSQMMNDPTKYIGNTVKMKGIYNLYYNQNDQTKTYSACIVKDATACCSQGLEFILKDGFDYPELDDEITVMGTFEVYDEDGVLYPRIKDAELL